ncbi:MAG: 3-deoxy-D-arabino-heptulosonate 7-phosphate synthase [SAR324 cluster bacterium]|nr:3-deoxy-D-arabino-heptulosonate 7-phosphate synthase [SAR324 cluster bacterium]
MIIPKEKRLTPEQLKEVQKIVAEFGLALQAIHGTERSIYAMIGDERDELLIARIEGLDYVDRVDQIQSPYKLMSKGNELAQHKITLGGKQFGGTEFRVIAGQCTIDPKNPGLFYETAHAVKEAGADMLRGGVWKPRTLPHSFQGDSKSIEILLEARKQTGLPIVTEVMDEEQLNIAIEAKVDLLQVGARNALNYSLLKQLGKKTQEMGIGVLLKRSIHMGTLDEFIAAGEYVVAGGNPNLLLCPRGTMPAMDGYRNHPDESIAALLVQKTWAPIVVDPSHSVGKSMYVPHAALSAAAYGAHGIIVECHIHPREGIGDDPKQAITPEVLKQLVLDVKKIAGIAKNYTQFHS